MAASEFRSGITSVIATGLLLAATTLAWAQAGTAGLTGTVRDVQGAVLPGATVTATNPATGAVRTTVTNSTGSYNFPAVPPGTYTLKIELSGFSPFVHENVILRVDTNTQVDAPLTIGGVAETVTVTEATPLINTTDASVGATMSRETIERLPVEARNVVHLLSLQPGAVFIPTTNPDTVDPRYRIGGWRAIRPAECDAGRCGRERSATAGGLYISGPHDTGSAAGIPGKHHELWRRSRPIERSASVARHPEWYEQLRWLGVLVPAANRHVE